ncbi:GNAT family N-acetyltransferase [Nonomuraea rubra]|uniref:GNAT family N-acetyltransferase n=1 Tax=Nonomuraea rubra TaxID=46180 RepID=UPI00361FA154
MSSVKAAELAEAAEVAEAALTLDAGEGAALVGHLSRPPAGRRWTALAVDGGVVMASMSDKDPGVGHLDLLAVRPEARGEGRGRTLVRAAEEWLREQGRARPASPGTRRVTPGPASTCGTPPPPAWPRASATSATTWPGT